MVEIYTTYDPMEANLIKAKLRDEEIEFAVKGDSDIAVTMEAFNAELTRMAMRNPIKFYVAEKDEEFAKIAINTDKSDLLKDDLEY
ncbi:MAG: DUF2007 domain-containing protein [Bacteroidetes bacterium]|nr:DUF2007 domain-containing protein [Bacteroidota bacterium]MBX7045056.1 DUF2007 domain-containing protein [Ignavibacteria bacterium]